MEPQLLFAQLVENIHQEDNTRTHIGRHKLSTNSTSSPMVYNPSLEIDNLTVDDVHTMEQDTAHGINIIRHKYSNDPNFNGKALFPKFCKKFSRSGHSISMCPDKRYKKQLAKPNFQKQTFNQSMKGNQNLPNRQVTSNNMTGKQLPFSYRSRSNNREHRNNSRHRSPNRLHKTTQNHIMEIVILNHQAETTHHIQNQISKTFHTIILDHNHPIITRTEIAHDDRSQEIDFVTFECILIHY